MGKGTQRRNLVGVGGTEHGVPYKVFEERGWGPLKTRWAENPSKWALLCGGGVPFSWRSLFQGLRGGDLCGKKERPS